MAYLNPTSSPSFRTSSTNPSSRSYSVELVTNGGQKITLVFGSEAEYKKFVLQVETMYGKKLEELYPYQIKDNFFEFDSNSGTYTIKKDASTKIAAGQTIFSDEQISLIMEEQGLKSLDLTGSVSSGGVYIVRVSGKLIKFSSKEIADKVLKLAASQAGVDRANLSFEDIQAAVTSKFGPAALVKSGSSYVLSGSANKQVLAYNPIVWPITYEVDLSGQDINLKSFLSRAFGPDNIYDSDANGPSARAATVIKAARALWNANSATPGFAKEVKPANSDVLKLAEAIFGPSKNGLVPVGQLKVLEEMGFIKPTGPNGGYELTDAGQTCLQDFTKPGRVIFVPSSLALSTTPGLAKQIAFHETDKNSATTPESAVSAYYQSLSRQYGSRPDVPEERFSAGHLGNGAMDVLNKLYGGKHKNNLTPQQYSPYNATQVNLALAAGYLQIDSKGIITATDKGNQLLTPPKTQETSPVPSSPAGDYYKHLGVILGQPTDPNALEIDQESDAVKDAKKIFFSDGKFDWNKVNAIRQDTSNKYTDDQKNAAQYMWDNKDKLLIDPLFATLSVGFDTKRDNKFSYTEALNVYRGLRTALRPSWNEPAAGDGVPKVNPQTKKPYTKREYAALVLENLKNKFDTHDRKNEATSLRNRDSTQGSHFVWFTDDFINDLKKSGNPDYIELGNQLAWLRDNCPDIWFLLKGNDDLVALSDLNAALGLLAPGNYPAPKAASKPDAAPAA